MVGKGIIGRLRNRSQGKFWLTSHSRVRRSDLFGLHQPSEGNDWKKVPVILAIRAHK